MCSDVYWCVLMCTDVCWCVQWCTEIFPMHKSNCNETRKDTENTIINETRKYTETCQNICFQTRWNTESPRWIHNTETHGNIYLEENETRETRKEYKNIKTRQGTERNKLQPSVTRFGTNSWNVFETRKAQTRHGTCLTGMFPCNDTRDLRRLKHGPARDGKRKSKHGTTRKQITSLK